MLYQCLQLLTQCPMLILPISVTFSLPYCWLDLDDKALEDVNKIGEFWWKKRLQPSEISTLDS